MVQKKKTGWQGLKAKFATPEELSNHMSKISKKYHKSLGHKISRKK